MTQIFTLFGASDDLVEADGVPGADEFNWLKSRPWTAVLTHEESNQSMTVHAFYGLNGTWHVGIGQLDEDTELPAWPCRITVNPDMCAYSSYLEVEVPDDTILTNVCDED